MWKYGHANETKQACNALFLGALPGGCERIVSCRDGWGDVEMESSSFAVAGIGKINVFGLPPKLPG